MRAEITKMKLKSFKENKYFRIELKCEDGKTRIIDNPLLANSKNFRNQVFGIMKEIGFYDLLKLATTRIKPKKVTTWYDIDRQRTEFIKNKKNMEFYFNKEKKIYCCEKFNRKIERIIESCDWLYKEDAEINSIISASSTFSIVLNFESGTTTYIDGGQMYMGFGNPIFIGENATENEIDYSSKFFETFIVALMDFYGINDLLNFGGSEKNFQ